MRVIKTRRIAVVEYLRGLASLAVAWFHLTSAYIDTWVGATGSLGWLGVDVFFVISGFVIPYSIWRAYPDYSVQLFPQFLARRIVRLEPPYICSLALVIVLHHISSQMPGFQGVPPPNDFAQIASHIFYLIPVIGYDWLQPVYWSLAYEFAFYIIIGLSFSLITGVRGTAIWIAICACLILGVLSGIITSKFLLFVVGISLFRCVVALQDIYTCIGLITICGCVIGCSGNLESAVTALASATIIYYGLDFELKGKTGKALLFCGLISYSLYLVHVPIGGRIVNLGRRFVDGPVESLLLSIFALLIAVGFAALFHKFAEQPFVQKSRHVWTFKKASAI